MRSMFYNYDNNIDSKLDQVCIPPIQLPDLTTASKTATIYNIKGEPIGIEITRGAPVTLYFNLTELSGQYLPDILVNSTVKFELITQGHKGVLEKNLDTLEVFNSITQDLAISLTSADTTALKQESYKIKLYLNWPEESYPVFTEKDGLLIVR